MINKLKKEGENDKRITLIEDLLMRNLRGGKKIDLCEYDIPDVDMCNFGCGTTCTEDWCYTDTIPPPH